jgi:hypothetical protein
MDGRGASLIRFKFKNARDSEVVYFDGVALPIQTLKTAIIAQKGLLQLTIPPSPLTQLQPALSYPGLQENGVDLVVQDAETMKGLQAPEALQKRLGPLTPTPPHAPLCTQSFSRLQTCRRTRLCSSS